jgi:hypothetical protein
MMTLATQHLTQQSWCGSPHVVALGRSRHLIDRPRRAQPRHIGISRDVVSRGCPHLQAGGRRFESARLHGHSPFSDRLSSHRHVSRLACLKASPTANPTRAGEMAGSMRLVRRDTWELRVYAGRDQSGRVRHLHRTFRGTKRSAQLELARLVVDQTTNPLDLVPEADGDETAPIPWDSGTTINAAITAWRANGWDDLSPKAVRGYEEISGRYVRTAIADWPPAGAEDSSPTRLPTPNSPPGRLPIPSGPLTS